MRHSSIVLSLCLALVASGCATVTPIESPEEPVAVVIGHPPALPPVPEPPPDPPPPPPPKAVLGASAVELREPVQFVLDEGTLAESAGPVLDEVADLLDANPWIRTLSIEVHTDGQGGKRAQRKLAQTRAVAVQAYLVERGVDAERIAIADHVPSEADRVLELLIVEGQPPEAVNPEEEVGG